MGTTPPLRLPRINLLRKNIERISFIIEIPWLEEAQSHFNDLLRVLPTDFAELQSEPAQSRAESKELPSRDFFSFTKYRRDSQNHVIEEIAEYEKSEDKEHLRLTISYTTEEEFPPGPVPKVFRKEGEIYGRLFQLSGLLAIDVHCYLVFPANTEDELLTVFPLPTRLAGQSEESLVDEIRGVRGVKLGRDGQRMVEYRFILDRPTNRDVYVSLEFSVETHFSEGTLVELIDRSMRLAQSMVVANRTGSSYELQ
jgi:hypothetical protein